MGRLFWKFLLAFLLAQGLAALALFLAIGLFNESWEPPPPPPPAISNAWQANNDARGLPWRPGPPGPPPWTPGFAPPPPPGPPPPPYLPLLAILIGCLAASALLAWYFAKPVRTLRWALGAVAEGRLETRIQSLMGRRRDEIADLGRDFDRMALELQRLVESQRQLLHDVSHELRSPLARLQAAIGLARQDPAQIEMTFDRIECESARLATLVGELLTLARLESGRDKTPKVALDLVELLADIAEDARFEARSNGRDLHFSGSGEWFVMGRVESLHRAFENVLRNAVKYTRQGSTVEVALEGRTSGLVCVSVRDRGPGVVARELETIFQPFHRGHQGASTEGFGLGLAIARRVIQSHQGTILASLPEGGGLRVEICLPLQPRPV
jgi:two-component system OmpR family sensor kinase